MKSNAKSYGLAELLEVICYLVGCEVNKLSGFVSKFVNYELRHFNFAVTGKRLWWLLNPFPRIISYYGFVNYNKSTEMVILEFIRRNVMKICDLLPACSVEELQQNYIQLEIIGNILEGLGKANGEKNIIFSKNCDAKTVMQNYYDSLNAGTKS